MYLAKDVNKWLLDAIQSDKRVELVECWGARRGLWERLRRWFRSWVE